MPKAIAVVFLALTAGLPRSLVQGRVVTGLALDSACALLPGVTVTIEGKRAVVTDKNGRFEVRGVEGTEVTMHAELAGFRSVERASEPWSGPRQLERVFMLPAGLVEVLPVNDGRQKFIVPGERPVEQRLRGKVLDESCRPLANASIRVVHGGRDLVVLTDPQGQFTFESITSGTHDIEVTATGFIPTVIRGFAIDENNTGEIFIALDRGAPHERTTVLPK